MASLAIKMISFSILSILLLTMWGCDSGGTNESPPSGFSKSVNVFGVMIRATENVPDEKVLHAARIMAEYLDNDEDGSPDNQEVVNEMVRQRASLIMVRDENELESLGEEALGGISVDAAQDLHAIETIPGGAQQNRFDASLEEVLHLITHVGYANVYPDVFGERIGSEVANAMDLARGGQFESIPTSYPDGAWYTYDDQTCDYSCMVTEYTYWALTSILGGQEFPGRLDQIDNEWRLNTREKVESGDPAVYTIMTNPQYNLPSILPDGVYTGINLVLE